MWWKSPEQQSVFGVPLSSALSASCRQNGSPSVVWPPSLPVSTASTTGPDVRATFGEFIERWKTEVLTTQKPSSARAVRSHLRCYIIPEVGKLRLDEFGIENQQRFITRMPERSTEKVVSPKTILNVIATISTILATARNWGYSCERIDMNKLHLPPRGVASEARHFTIEQVQRILALGGEPWGLNLTMRSSGSTSAVCSIAPSGNFRSRPVSLLVVGRSLYRRIVAHTSACDRPVCLQTDLSSA
jgi:hypothetical protein